MRGEPRWREITFATGMGCTKAGEKGQKNQPITPMSFGTQGQERSLQTHLLKADLSPALRRLR